ncbi:MAG: DNA repair protein RecO [bacterium]
MQALVLTRRDFREVDQIISFYTKDLGKLDLLAKGVKKITSKNSGNLLPGALVEIEIAKGKEVDHLTKVQPLELFKNSRKDLKKILMVDYVVKLVDKLVSVGEKDQEVFFILFDWLCFLERNDTVCESLIFGFIIQLFKILGFQMDLENCIECGTTGNFVGFSILGGGVVCGECKQSQAVVALNRGQYNYLQKITGDWDEINKLINKPEIFELIHEFIQYHSEKKINRFNIEAYASIN